MNEFSFVGSPHRPLQPITTKASGVVGHVASTGHSSLHKVLDSLKTYGGGRGYSSPKQEHWNSLLVKYDEAPISEVRKPRKTGTSGKRATISSEIIALVEV